MRTIIRQNLKRCQGITVNIPGCLGAVLPYNNGMDLEDRLKALGRIIRDARTEKEWTQSELADRVRLSIGYISNIEKGYINPKRGPVVPSDVTLASFAEALNISVSSLHSALGRDVDKAEEITYELDPDALALAEGYSGLPDYAREIVDSAYKSASKLALEMDRESSIGKRAE